MEERELYMQNIFIKLADEKRSGILKSQQVKALKGVYIESTFLSPFECVYIACDKQIRYTRKGLVL